MRNWQSDIAAKKAQANSLVREAVDALQENAGQKAASGVGGTQDVVQEMLAGIYANQVYVQLSKAAASAIASCKAATAAEPKTQAHGGDVVDNPGLVALAAYMQRG